MSHQSRNTQLVYLRLTGAGRGAVASLLIQGDKVLSRIGELFQPRSRGSLVEVHEQAIIYGNWIIGDEMGEDLVLCPVSDSTVEIHCHGGEAAIETITTSLELIGFRAASSEETFKLTESNIWRYDIRRALTLAKTARTAEILLRQYHSIEAEIHKLMDSIRTDPTFTQSEIRKVLQNEQFGFHLTRPWQVVLCGAPNVGKSSLINAIVGFERAIVHSTAGTTRDVVSETTSVNGWPIELKDTAGLRESAFDEAEEQGISRARQEMESADLVIYVVDASTELEEGTVAPSQRSILVANKADLVEPHLRKKLGGNGLFTSAVSGEGISDLIDLIARKLVPHVPSDGQLIPVNEKQLECFSFVVQLIAENKHAEAMKALENQLTK